MSKHEIFEKACATSQNRKPSLPTGERFHTNFPIAGGNLTQGYVSLEDYLNDLGGKYESVKVESTATDISGRSLEGDVAIYIGKRRQTNASA